MNTGRFFLLDRDSDPTKGIFLFKYRRLVDPTSNQYKVYLTIQRDAIEFFYCAKGRQEHTRLFKLSMHNSSNSQGDIYQQLNFILSLKKHEAPYLKNISLSHSDLPELEKEFPHYASLKCWKSINPKVDNLIHRYEKNIKKERWDIALSFPMLFLDFLFDMNHSMIFRESPYFEKIRLLIQENVLFNAISAKAEYNYRAALLELEMKAIKDTPKEETSPNIILREHFKEARKNWFQVLMAEEHVNILSNSPWFQKDVESEAEEILNSQGLNETVVLSDKLSRSIVDFYLERMNYGRAAKFSFHHRMGQHLLYGSIIAFIVASLFFLHSQWLGALLIIPPSIMIGWLWYKPFDFVQKPLDSSIVEIFDLFMPRLQITLFLAWLTYAALNRATPSLDKTYNLILLCAMLTLILLYLTRSINRIAPDLEWKQRIRRTLSIASFAFISSGIMGIFLLSFSLRSAKELPDIQFTLISNYEFAFLLWLNATVLVMFSGLFVNLLFRERKLTGF